MKKIKLQYCDFWDSFKPESSFFTRALKNKFEVEIVKENPDLLIYGVFGSQHNSIKAKTKLAFSQENSFPNFSECDYAISSVKVHVPGRTFYFPAALYYISSMSQEIAALDTKSFPITQELSERKFCCFVYSQAQIGLGAVMRRVFASKLMEYKHVECPGRVLHNTNVPELTARGSEDWHESKLNYLRKFKFVIAFENSDNIGYISEKLLDAYMTNTIPIYWGSTADVSPFPKESMICAADYPTLDALIEKIKKVDTDPELYLSILKANPLYNTTFVQQLKETCVQAEVFIQNVAESAFIIKPQFQDWHRKSTKSTVKESPNDVEYFCRIMPRYHSIHSEQKGMRYEINEKLPAGYLDELKYNINAYIGQIIIYLSEQFSNESNILKTNLLTNTSLNRLKLILFKLRLKRLFSRGSKREKINSKISTLKKLIRENNTLIEKLFN